MVTALRITATFSASLVVFLVAAPLRAQPLPAAGGTFVDGFVTATWDDARYPYTHVDGAVPGYGVALGVDAGKSGIEIGVHVPQWHTRTQVQRFQYVGPPYAYEQPGQFYEQTYTERRRSIDVSVMYRRSAKIAPQVAFTWLLGGAYVYRPDVSTTVTKEVDGVLSNVSTYKSTRNYLAGAARVDFEITIARHVAVVPRLQMLVFPSGLDDSGLAPRAFVGRPEVAVRWRF